MSTLTTEVSDLVRLAHKQGWDVEMTGGGHYKWTPPAASGIVTNEFIITSSTPGSPISWDNDKARLKRAGLIMTRAEFRRAERAKRADNHKAGLALTGTDCPPSGANVHDVESRLRDRVQAQRAADAVVVGPVVLAEPVPAAKPVRPSPMRERSEAANWWNSHGWCKRCGRELLLKNYRAHMRLWHGITEFLSGEAGVAMFCAAEPSKLPDDVWSHTLNLSAWKKSCERSRRDGVTSSGLPLDDLPDAVFGPVVLGAEWHDAAGTPTYTAAPLDAERQRNAAIRAEETAAARRIAESGTHGTSQQNYEQIAREMLKVIWPDGFPLNPDHLVLLADWLEPTKKFLQQVLTNA